MNKNQYLRLVLTLIVILNAFYTSAQSTDELMRLYFNEVRAGKYQSIPKQLSISENAKSVFATLPLYLKDSLAAVRSKAYTLVQLAGNNSRHESIREAAVQRLIDGAADKDGGNAGIALDYLTSFHKSDFNTTATDSLRRLFRRRSNHFQKIIKLCGFLQLTDLKEELRPYTQTGNTQVVRWAALVSLSRMNDAVATEEVVRRARKLPVNDDVIYSVFPDLIYTRNREAIAYVLEVLNKDDATCMTADAERQAAIPCGYRVMEQLAPVIKGYPLQLDASGDVKTNDYVAALKAVREWFVKHPNFEILTDRY